MADWTLHYFKMRGRAEPLRLVLAQAGLPYTDKLYTPAEWKEVKASMPEGKGVPHVTTRPAGNRGIPVLELKSGEKINETADIGEYIAKRAPKYIGLMPADPALAQKAKAMFLETQQFPLYFCNGMLTGYPMDIVKAIQRGEKPKGTMHGDIGNLPAFSGVAEKLRAYEAELGDRQFFGGSAPHFGELALLCTFDSLRIVDPSAASKYAGLQKWSERVAALPAVKRYLNSRPQAGQPGSGGPHTVLFNLEKWRANSKL